ncbi:MAG: LysR family transcriptional regulator [Gammaproteobacteria bacterium]
MNISKINLNLLIAFDALISERHVTRAGEKIHLTQSAMSVALKQLRTIFNDPLLVRSNNKMIPTTKALKIAPMVHNILHNIEHLVFHHPVFDPSNSTRTFTIGMSDYAEFVLLPKLFEILSKSAPHIKLQIQRVDFTFDNHCFTDNPLDIVVGVPNVRSTQAHYMDLYQEKYVCLINKKHPLINQPMTLKNYLAHKHVRLKEENKSYLNMIDTQLSKFNKQREIVMSVSRIFTALVIVSQTNLIITMPYHPSRYAAELLELHIKEVPLSLPLITITQAWHASKQDDPGHRWLRETIYKASLNLSSKKSRNNKALVKQFT